MSYKAAREQIAVPEAETSSGAFPNDLEVWLVVLQGSLTITPPSGDISTPHEGCAHAILEASNGEGREAGGFSCYGLDQAG